MKWPITNAEIIQLILSPGKEGGYVDNPSDKGGPTNMGITIETLGSFRGKEVTVADIKALTVAEATDLYLHKFIISPNFDQLTDLPLRTAMVDFGVLFGPVRAIQALQLILGLKIDGFLGPKSLSVANALQSSRSVINQLSVVRIEKHTDRVVSHPDQLVFFRGWISRALSFLE